MNQFKQLLFTAACLLLATAAFAQVKVGDNPTVINPNAVLEMETTNKGMLLPRVALTSTTAAAPLSAFVEGMTVYNTATAGDVTPGYYYCDGTQWVRLATGGMSEWTDGDIPTFGGTTPGIYAADALANGDTISISNDGRVTIGNNGLFTQEGKFRVKTDGRLTADPFNNILGAEIVANGFENQEGLASVNGLLALNTYAGTGPNNTLDVNFIRNVRNNAIKRGSGNLNAIIASENLAEVGGTSSGTVGTVTGVSATARVFGSGNITDVYALRANVGSNGSFTGQAENVTGILISGSWGNNSLPFLHRKGLEITSIPVTAGLPGATAYSIYTNQGRVSLGDTLQLRSVPTGTAVNGLGVDVDGNVITTDATMSEWAEGDIPTFGGTTPGIYAADALANGDTIAISDDGRVTIGNNGLFTQEGKFRVKTDDRLTADPFNNILGAEIVANGFENREGLASVNGLLALNTYAGTGPGNTLDVNFIRNVRNNAIKRGSGNLNAIIASENLAEVGGTSSGTVGTVTGVSATARVFGSGNITDVYALRANVGSNGSFTGQAENVTGILIDGAWGNNSLPFLHRKGLEIASIPVTAGLPGATAYSIYTNDGLISFGDNVEQRGTGYFKVAVGTTAQRPATPEAGMIRFNSDTGVFEGYDGTSWVNLN